MPLNCDYRPATPKCRALQANLASQQDAVPPLWAWTLAAQAVGMAQPVAAKVFAAH